MRARLPLGAAGLQRACLIVMAAAPFLAYRLRDISPAWVMAVCASGQAAAISAMAPVPLRYSGTPAWRGSLAAAVFAATLAVILALGLSASVIALAAGGICHALAYVGLLCWFGRSLLPGREPVVTILARRVRRTMPDRVVIYTRKVTIAWCVFFLGQLAASAVLLATAPEAVWTTFIGWLNLPLVAAMVLGEYGIRAILFRHETRTSLRGTLAAMRGSSGALAMPPQPRLIGMPHTGMPNTGMPHTGLSHTGMSHTGMSHTGMSHTGMSHTGMSHTGMSHTGMSRTGMTGPQP